jgi:MFS superfamily sulfate permease-like transporter
MKKGLKIGLMIGGGLALATGTFFLVKYLKKKKAEKQLSPSIGEEPKNDPNMGVGEEVIAYTIPKGVSFTNVNNLKKTIKGIATGIITRLRANNGADITGVMGKQPINKDVALKFQEKLQKGVPASQIASNYAEWKADFMIANEMEKLDKNPITKESVKRNAETKGRPYLHSLVGLAGWNCDNRVKKSGKI